MAGRTVEPQALHHGDHATLLRLSQSRGESATAARAQIVLLAAEGLPNVEIAQRTGLSRPTVNLWRRRYALHGIAALTGSARKSAARIDPRDIMLATVQPSDPRHPRQRSSRLLASTLDVSHVTVTRAWRTFGFRPSDADTFTFLTEPPFTAATVDLHGIYVSPIECAVMLSAEHPARATDAHVMRPEAIRPTIPAERVTELGAALLHATNTPPPARTSVDSSTFLNFLEVLDRNQPSTRSILVVDNVATVERPVVRQWLTAHPHVAVATAPTPTTWLNMLDIWLTLMMIRPSAGPVETADLMKHIRPLAVRSAGRQPFVWTVARQRPRLRNRDESADLGLMRRRAERRRPPPSGGLPGPRGFPFIAQAGHTQVAPDRVISYPRVQSRAVVGCHMGQGTLTLNGEDHPLRPGLLYVLPWDHSIVYRPDPRNPFFVFGFHVIPWQLAQEPLRFSAPHTERDQFFDVSWRKPCPPGEPEPAREVVATTETERPGLAALTRYAIERFLRGLPSPAEGRALGMLAVAELNASSSVRPEEDPTLPAGLRGLLVWIMRDLSRSVTLADMAAVLECSPSTVTRQFRQNLGCAPLTWLIDQRIALAQRLLAAGNPTIAAVARSCGYHDAEYFSRLFKDRVGFTPREWRSSRTI